MSPGRGVHLKLRTDVSTGRLGGLQVVERYGDYDGGQDSEGSYHHDPFDYPPISPVLQIKINDAPVESYSLALTVGSGHYRRIEIANVFELF